MSHYAYISNVFIMEMRNNEICNICDAFRVILIKKLKILLYLCNLFTDKWPLLHIWSHLPHTEVPSTICCVSVNAFSCFKMFKLCLDNWSIERYGNWSFFVQWLKDCGLESPVCEMCILSVTSLPSYTATAVGLVHQSGEHWWS
jgi:hypothetical protein